MVRALTRLRFLSGPKEPLPAQRDNLDWCRHLLKRINYVATIIGAGVYLHQRVGHFDWH